MQPHGMLDGTCKHGEKQFCGKCVQERAEAAEAERDAARARVAALEAEVAELHKARDLAGVIAGDGNTLCDWIIGAHGEIAHLAGQLHNAYEWLSETPEWLSETPLGQALDGMGDEVEP